jgi:hypothetical protein
VKGKVFLWLGSSLGILVSIVALALDQIVLTRQDMAEGRNNVGIAWEPHRRGSCVPWHF